MSSSHSFARYILILLLSVTLVASVGAVQQASDESRSDDAAAPPADDEQQRAAASANTRTSSYTRAGARYANWDEYRQAVSSAYEGQDPALYAKRAIGMDTWYHWTAGNQFFFRGLTRQTEGNVDFFRVIIQTPRSERFRRIGGINDPSCRPAAEPDDFGLTNFDQWKP
jgi:hypothetical protein